MTYSDTIGLVAPTARSSSRYLPRRAGEAPAPKARKPVAFRPPAPLGATSGLSSHHYLGRAADDAAAAAAAAEAVIDRTLAFQPPSPSWNASEWLPTVDAGTPELRRRIATVIATEPARRLSRSLGWSIAGGISVLLWLGAAFVVWATFETLSRVF